MFRLSHFLQKEKHLENTQDQKLVPGLRWKSKHSNLVQMQDHHEVQRSTQVFQKVKPIALIFTYRHVHTVKQKLLM